jgi:hypothetical protein
MGDLLAVRVSVRVGLLVVGLVVVGQGGVVHAAGEFGLVGFVDEARVVDASRSWWRCWGFGAGFGMGVPADVVRDRAAAGNTVKADFDGGEVKRVEHQLNFATNEAVVDLIGVAVQGNRRGFGDGAAFFPEERLGQRGRGGQRERAAGLPASQRRLAGFRVHGAVIDGLDPGGEQPVQLEQITDMVAARLVLTGDLDQELIPDAAEVALDLPAALRASGGGMGEFDPEFRAGAQQPRVDERRAVIDIDRLRHSPRRQSWAQRGSQPDGVFRVAEPVTDDRPGVVVQEREQVSLPPVDLGAVEGVAGPELVGTVGLEPTEHRAHHRRRGRAGQAEPGEVPLQGPFVRGPAQLSAQDPPDPGGGPVRVLPP